MTKVKLSDGKEILITEEWKLISESSLISENGCSNLAAIFVRSCDRGCLVYGWSNVSESKKAAILVPAWKLSHSEVIKAILSVKEEIYQVPEFDTIAADAICKAIRQ